MTFRIEVIDATHPKNNGTYNVNGSLENAKATARGLMKAHGLVGASIYDEAERKLWTVTHAGKTETDFTADRSGRVRGQLTRLFL